MDGAHDAQQMSSDPGWLPLAPRAAEVAAKPAAAAPLLALWYGMVWMVHRCAWLQFGSGACKGALTHKRELDLHLHR